MLDAQDGDTSRVTLRCVKAKDIRGLARQWAKGPVFVACNNGGANRGWNGDDWARLIITLQTMQGNIGKPGGNLNDYEILR
jgi:anaerobic selenocysteine-containing dehydrogenase